MSAMSVGKFLSIWLLALVIGGCSRTLYESLPVGKTTTCDPAWPGRWKAEDPEHKKQIEEAWITINADCTEITSTDQDGTKREDFKLELVATRAGDFLWVSDNDRKPECLESDSMHCGYSLMKYIRAGDEIRVYNPDHNKVHAAIADRSVPGHSQPLGKTRPTASANDTSDAALAENASSAAATRGTGPSAQDITGYNNQISGNAEQIATILEQHPEFFESEPWMILHRDNPQPPSKQP
jgi:hypothetical protein